MSKRHIRIDLGSGAWARVSPDIQPETVEALRRMMEAARKHFGEPITVHRCDIDAMATTEPRLAGWWEEDAEVE